MIGRIVGHGKKARYYLDGKEVSKRQFQGAFPDREMAVNGGCALSSVPAMHSEALEICPEDVPAAMEDAKRHGVPTEFDKEGRPIFTSREHQRRYAQAYGYHNNDENWSGRHENDGPDVEELHRREMAELDRMQ